MTRLEQALRLASLGFLISPLQAGRKVPFAGESWQQMQTTDAETIRGWFSARPNMNYAVCPGPAGVIIDPDVDVKAAKDGLKLLTEIEAENFEDQPILGSTFTVLTPRGGRHIYLKSPFPVSNRDGGFPDGIDVRGAGGYVVGPGCHTDDNGKDTAEGTYTVEVDLPVLDAPQWVVGRLDKVRERDSNAAESIGDEDTETAVEQVRGLIRQQVAWPTEGQGGDNATYEFIALARNWASVTPDKMFELLNEPYKAAGETEARSWNDRCDPPWDDVGLHRKIENVYSYATSAAGSKGGVLESMDMEGSEYVGIVDPEIEKAQKRVRSKLDDMFFPGEALTKRAVRREYVIDQWMLSHGMTQLLAFRSTGKSILMLDLCLRIACDMDWFNYKVAEGWAVVYACGEDDEGIQAQMDAWKMENGVEVQKDRFIVMTGVPDLNNETECFEWITFLKEKLKGRRAIFAVDTWQRATSKASQNDDQMMNVATDMVDFIADQLGGPSLIAFHPPKGNTDTISGSMLIENKGSAIWKMSADAVVKRVFVDRIKGKGRGNFLKVFFNEINLPYKDQWGKPSTAIVIGFAGDNNGDSKALKDASSTVKSVWAQIIHDMIVAAEYDGDPKLDQGDVATRLLAWVGQNGNDEHLRELHRLGDSVPTSHRNLCTRLKNLFPTNGPMTPCRDGIHCIYVVQATGTARGQKFIRDELTNYMQCHPDKCPVAIAAPGEEEAREGVISF